MSGAPGIVNQTPRTIRSYIVVIFTPNPTYIHVNVYVIMYLNILLNILFAYNIRLSYILLLKM